ncbi:MAG: hypothetical protein R6U39_10705 [Candidatus Aegiribacteria sp.]
MTSVPLAVLLASGILALSSCDRETRVESRRQRLDTFRECMPDSLRESFDAISGEDDCSAVAIMMERALADSPAFAAKLDSIVHAELIDTFTAEEIVYFFWYYFDYAIETGSVRGP